MPASVGLAFFTTALLAALTSGCGAGNDLGGGGQEDGRPATAARGVPPLDRHSRQIVEQAVRQIIGERGSARIKTMTAAPSKAAAPAVAASDAAASPGAPRTSVCGYVSYRNPNGGSAQERYFIELGRDAGRLAALRGQVALSPAKRAKVDFICAKAGL